MDRYGGVTPTAPPLTGPALFDQSWRDLFFLHWAVDPAAVAPFMPRGVRPDVFDGVTYVGLVPFRMVDAGLGQHHATPYFGSFLECNVRLYSVDEAGRHGVVFRSLEATRSFTSMAARWGYRLPYTWANMHVRQRGDHWWWRSDRRYPLGGGSMRLEAQTGEEIEPTDLEVFVTARWGLHHEAFGATWWTPNEHDPWVLQATKVAELRQDLVAQAGIVVADQPTLRPLYSPGVYTAFGFPQRIA